MGSNKISRNLKENEKYIKQILGESADLILRTFVIPAFNDCKALIVYIDGLVENEEMDDIILKPLMANLQFSMGKGYIAANGLINAVKEAGLLAPGIRAGKEWDELLDSMLSGDTLVFVDTCDEALITATRGWQSRSISEPLAEGEVRAPRDGFVENVRSNTALLRRRVRDYSLRIESMKIGERTKTDIALVYIDNLVNKDILGELKARLNRIETDSILETGYIEEFIEDSPLSLFPTLDHTERPDKASAAILEGRIALLVDNTPFCLIVPTVFWQYFQATGDYYEKFYVAIFLRWLRYIALFVSFSLSSVYIMLSAFHQEMYPTLLALRVAAGREGVPFPSVMEVLFMEFMFEIMREAGIRMPKPVGQAVSIVGALVVGDAAVNAGLVGPILVIVVAAAGICSFAVPAYSLSWSFRLIRFPLIILTSTLGLLGFLGGLIFIVLHLISLRSFGVPYMAPMAPVNSPGNKDVLIRVPWWLMKKRPRIVRSQDQIRQADKEILKPKPPKNND